MNLILPFAFMVVFACLAVLAVWSVVRGEARPADAR